MQIQLTGQGMEVTDALRDLTNKKLNKIKKHNDHISHVHVTFKIDKLSQCAVANVSVPGSVINAQAESDDMYKTVDLLIHKIESQLAKHKEK